MEDFDELLPTADDDGSLDLSHRAWTDVDDVIWTMVDEVVSLSLSHNRLPRLASDIGDLRLLRVLDISCNAIESLPSRIGLLRRLEVLKCNGNRLFELPDELSSCLLLAELNCSENVLASLPRSLGNIENLHTLLVQNNQLESLPPTLANAPLDNINCRNNPRLHQTMIPKQMSDDVDFIVWILRLCRNQEIEMKRISDSTSQLKQLGNFAHQRQAQLSAHLRNSREECLALMRNAPTGLLGKLAAAAKHVSLRRGKRAKHNAPSAVWTPILCVVPLVME